MPNLNLKMDREFRTLNFPQPTSGFLGTGQIGELPNRPPGRGSGFEVRRGSGFSGTGQITNFPNKRIFGDRSNPDFLNRPPNRGSEFKFREGSDFWDRSNRELPNRAQTRGSEFKFGEYGHRLDPKLTGWKSMLRCPAIEHLGRLLRAVAEGGAVWRCRETIATGKGA